MNVYNIFGVRIGSSYPFVYHSAEDFDTFDITFRQIYESPYPDWEKNAPIFVGKTNDDEIPYLLIFRHKDFIIYSIPEIDFFIRPNTIEGLIKTESSDDIELLLFGKILSLWLELRGVPCLHASSVVMNDGAVGFLSSSHGGKSVLAASMMRAGHPLLTDDILPVRFEGARFFGAPGNASMRMWPDQAEYFLGSYEDLDLVHPSVSKRRVPVGERGFGMFCREEQPLKLLYIPEKNNSGDEVVIEPMTPRDAFFELVKNSYAVRIIEALGKEAQRMKFFADMASRLPIRRLRYPEGFQHLSSVVECIHEDLDSL